MILENDKTSFSPGVIQLRKKAGTSVILDASEIPEEFRHVPDPPIENTKEGEEESWWQCGALYGDIITFIEDLLLANPYLLCFLVVSIWISVGIIFYYYFYFWTAATSFYYVIEAGLSIGFCKPAEDSDMSRIFTIFFVFIASSIVSGTTGLFLVSLFAPNLHLVPAEHRFNAISYRDEVEEAITFQSVWRYCWYHCKYFLGWYSNRLRTIMTILFVIWMILGTCWGLFIENWTFITSLYWAVTSCSSGGLQTAPCINSTDDDGSNCDMGTYRGTIMGLYLLFGVPIYAITVSQWARRFFADVAQEREDQIMSRPIEDVQFLYAASILSGEGSETLVLGEYIFLELMRLGLVDQERIEDLKTKFYELDPHSKGELDLSDLREAGKIIPRKIHTIELAKRFRTRSLELFRHFGSSSSFPIPSPNRQRPNNTAAAVGPGSESPISSPSGRYIPRVDSAKEFFRNLAGSAGSESPQRGGGAGDRTSKGLIELPRFMKSPHDKQQQQQQRRPTKKAFRKSIRKSIITDETVTDLGEITKTAGTSPISKTRGSSLEFLFGKASDDDEEKQNGGNGLTTAGSPYRSPAQHHYDHLFDDFDFNIDDTIDDLVQEKENQQQPMILDELDISDIKENEKERDTYEKSENAAETKRTSGVRRLPLSFPVENTKLNNNSDDEDNTQHHYVPPAPDSYEKHNISFDI
jgi:hypothetical protein